MLFKAHVAGIGPVSVTDTLLDGLLEDGDALGDLRMGSHLNFAGYHFNLAPNLRIIFWSEGDFCRRLL